MRCTYSSHSLSLRFHCGDMYQTIMDLDYHFHLGINRKWGSICRMKLLFFSSFIYVISYFCQCWQLGSKKDTLQVRVTFGHHELFRVENTDFHQISATTYLTSFPNQVLHNMFAETLFCQKRISHQARDGVGVKSSDSFYQALLTWNVSKCIKLLKAPSSSSIFFLFSE